MNQQAQPFFIVSSGRSGTQMFEKLLGSLPDIDMHHEYLCTHVQPLAVKYYMGLAGFDETCESLERLHGRAIRYSDRRLWGDSSNKLSWLIEPLDVLFPAGKFIFIVRDGRKVASSFFHKLAAECYDDRSTAILQAYVDHPERNPEPPPEKKYWWNLPRQDTPLAREFRTFNQFQRICFHWGEVNRFVIEKLARIPSYRQRFYKLEDLSSKPDALKDLLAFLDVPFSDEFFVAMQRPHNVGIPEDFPLTDEQRGQLMEIAGDMMRHFGYDQTEEYRMVYDAQRKAKGGTA